MQRHRGILISTEVKRKADWPLYLLRFEQGSVSQDEIEKLKKEFEDVEGTLVVLPCKEGSLGVPRIENL